jgi:signal transduction histidine kinase
MRKVLTISAIFLAGFLLFSMGAPDPAQARCKTFNASHNGTDMFYDEGTEGTVKNKLLWYVEQWKSEKNIKRVRIGRVSIKCSEWVEVHGKPRIFNISHDVTERKATERRLLEDRDTFQELVNEATVDLKDKALELETALAKEKELNELQRQFVSMASHEFRTPLAIIDSTAQRLKKSANRLSSEEVLKRIDKIRNAVVRMTRLMESTLTAARLDEGKIAVEMHPCDIGQIITEVCLRQQEISKDHIISYEMDGLPDSIKADASALDQILTNLLTNAVKYAPGEPNIQVSAHGAGDLVIIQVSDQGLGIDEDDMPNMFERFYRAKTSSGIVGTGIGLNLVKTLVEMHGGIVSIDSKKGEGITFTVSLPVSGPATTEKAA